jgi:hypothetical protein
VTILKNPYIFQSSGRLPGTIRPLAKPFSRFFFLSGRPPGTIRPLAKPFSRFILHWVGRLEQLDHSRSPFCVSSSYQASRLEQLDHSRNPFTFYSSSGRSPGTIRPLVKFFAFFYHRAGCPNQFNPFQKKKSGTSSK